MSGPKIFGQFSLMALTEVFLSIQPGIQPVLKSGHGREEFVEAEGAINSIREIQSNAVASSYLREAAVTCCLQLIN